MNYLSENSGVPLYVQLRDVLLQKIESGEWPAYEQIPTEEELARDYKIARTTVRRALSEMVQRGMLYRKSGKGTFVREREVHYRLRRSVSFSQDILSRGMVPGARLISAGLTKADTEICSSLSVPIGTPLIQIVRLRTADNRPVLINDIFMPAAIFPGLEKRPELAATQSSVYDMMTRDYRVSITRLQGYIRPIIADKSTARLLEVPQGSPIFKTVVVGTNPEGRPLIYAFDLVRGDWGFDISSD